MKTIIFLSIFLFLNTVFSQDLKIMYGDRIYYNYKGNLIEVKSVNHCKYICGYDLIDSTKVFIAYNPEDSGEPSINISIYDVVTDNEIIIGDLPGTSDSNFSYNSDNDYLVYNLYDGIYLLKIHEKDGTILNDIYGKTEKILSSDNCYTVYWIDVETVGYYSREKNKNVLKTLKIKN